MSAPRQAPSPPPTFGVSGAAVAGEGAALGAGGSLRRRLLPTAAEAATLRFLVPLPDLRTRLLAAGLLFTLGLTAWALLPFAGIFGLFLVLLGHLAIWVRPQTTAPGGATPAHEETWAPAEEGWLERLREHEERGERWDASPWDVSNPRGCFALVAVLAGLGGLAALLALSPSLEAPFRVAVGGAALLLPLWLNGLRTTWNPSELRKKGDALETAFTLARRLAGDDFEPIPMLALREGRRGHYPVDARLMLRPARDDGSGFLGVQVQVALNNVRGTDYPYLYAVVLGKAPFRWPPHGSRRRHMQGVDVVLEFGSNEGVDFLVVRQHADTSGGWHTDEEVIEVLVKAALDLGREAWQRNADPPAGGGR